MKHARPDYDRLQDPDGLIPADEPVFLLRSTDASAPMLVDLWAFLNLSAGADNRIVDAAYRQAEEMREYQREHGSKVADMPPVSVTPIDGDTDEDAAKLVRVERVTRLLTDHGLTPDDIQPETFDVMTMSRAEIAEIIADHRAKRDAEVRASASMVTDMPDPYKRRGWPSREALTSAPGIREADEPGVLCVRSDRLPDDPQTRALVLRDLTTITGRAVKVVDAKREPNEREQTAAVALSFRSGCYYRHMATGRLVHAIDTVVTQALGAGILVERPNGDLELYDSGTVTGWTQVPRGEWQEGEQVDPK